MILKRNKSETFDFEFETCMTILPTALYLNNFFYEYKFHDKI